ncbi:MAG: hypothetical protein AAGC47_15965 [Bacteroidota bacterium]
MKSTLMILLFVLVGFSAFSQKVKMSDKAKDKYMKEEKTESESVDLNTIEVFQILSAEISPRGEGFLLKLQESTSEIPTRVSTLQFPELKMLTANKYMRESEVDLLNYLSENGWTLITINITNFKGQEVRNYYIKKTITL